MEDMYNVPPFCAEHSKQVREGVSKVEDELREFKHDMQEDMSELREKVADMDKTFTVLAERNMATIDRAVTAIGRNGDGLEKLDTLLDRLSGKIEAIDGRLDSFESKSASEMRELRDEIEAVDDKTKVDTAEMTRDSMKEKLMPLIGGAGIVGAIMAIVQMVGGG